MPTAVSPSDCSKAGRGSPVTVTGWLSGMLLAALSVVTVSELLLVVVVVAKSDGGDDDGDDSHNPEGQPEPCLGASAGPMGGLGGGLAPGFSPLTVRHDLLPPQCRGVRG